MTAGTRDELDPYGDSLDVRRLALGLLRSARWVVALTLLGALCGLGYGLIQPNRYVSEGKIEVRLGARERRTPEDTLNPAGEVPVRTPGIRDEIELLYNPEVYRRIARAIGPERLLEPYDPTWTDGPDTALPMRWLHGLQAWWFQRQVVEHTPEEALEEAAARVHDAIDVTPLEGTSYLWIQSTATRPELARELTRTYVETARRWHREVYASATELSFVSDQLERYEEESLAAERAYAEHRDQCGFYDLEAQKESLVATLEEHDASLRANTIRLFEIEDELAFVVRELEATPATIEKIVPPSIKVNPEYQAAFEQLQELNANLARLATEYAEGSEIYRRRADQLEGEIERVDARLATIDEYIEYGRATREESENPRHVELAFRRRELEQEKATRTRTGELWSTSKEEQEARLRAALQCEPLHRDLARAVERTGDRVQQLSGALERAQALALLDRQGEMDSLRIAQEGDLPRGKSGPDRRRFLVLGLLGGLALGLLLATLRHLLDDRIHEAETLQGELDLPVLAAIPEVRRWRRAGAAACRRARDEDDE